MVDLHCHILPDFDDGAKNKNISLQMGKDAIKNNVTKIVSTSHYSCSAEINDFVKERNKKIEKLRKIFLENSVDVKLYPGAEVYLNDNIYFDNSLENLTINNTRYLLCELDFVGLTANKITRYFDEIVSRNLVPILAHPERYEFFQNDYDLVNFLADMGTLFQINFSSLAGIDSIKSQILARKMVESGMASFVATDAHGIKERSLKIDYYLSKLPQTISKERIKMLFEINPQKVLDGDAVRTKFKFI